MKRPENPVLVSSEPEKILRSLRFDEATGRRLRAQLMKKGSEIAALLADVLAGKDRRGRLRALPLDDKPGERPEEMLRRYLDLIEARRKLFDANDDRFGRCDVCGGDLGVPSLEEMPWADRCRAHAAVL
jgi:hypothetical protein